MPDDPIEQDPLTIPTPRGDSSADHYQPVTEEEDVAGTDLFDKLHEQQMGRLANIANAAHENFETVRHFSDLDHMEHKRTISLIQGVGIREVSSKKVPAGPVSD